jgi:hypothetical protein
LAAWGTKSAETELRGELRSGLARRFEQSTGKRPVVIPARSSRMAFLKDGENLFVIDLTYIHRA